MNANYISTKVGRKGGITKSVIQVCFYVLQLCFIAFSINVLFHFLEVFLDSFGCCCEKDHFPNTFSEWDIIKVPTPFLLDLGIQ